MKTLYKALALIGFLITFQNTLAKEIPSAYINIARQYRVPADILYAVALQESGYQFKHRFNAWPWTLNINGTGHRFATRYQAYKELNKSVSVGLSVDGCIMQINWRWHAHRFENLWSLLDPYTCVETGAEILVELYRQSNDWWVAVGLYHSPGHDKNSVARAARYRAEVKRKWARWL